MKNQTYSRTQLEVLENFEYAETAVMAANTHTGEMIAIRPCVENLGLNWSGQLQAIKRNEELHQLCVSVKAIAEDGKMREMVCLPPAAYNQWLFGLSTKSENFNFPLWEEYKKGLVIHIMMMLKVSLDEVKRTRGGNQLFEELKELNKKQETLQFDLVEINSKRKDKMDEIKEIQRNINEILKQDPSQIRIDFDEM